MKTILKTILFLVLTITMYSCSNENNSFTKAQVLEQLAEKEALNPIVFKTALSNIYLKSVNDIRNGTSYYSKLFNSGYLTTQLRTDIPNPNASSRPYKVISTPAAEPYVLEIKSDGAIVVKTLEFNAIEVKNIRILSNFKAEVDVVFKKSKSPFHNSSSKDIAPSGKEYPNDIYLKTLEFRKSNSANTWKLPIKIKF